MKHLLRLAPVIALAAFVTAGCAQLQQAEQAASNAWSFVTSNGASPNDAYIAINAFDAVEVTATNVLKLPLCGTTQSKACRPAGLRETIKKAILAGRVARNDVKAYLRANPGKALTISSFGDLKSATSTLQSIVDTYKQS